MKDFKPYQQGSVDYFCGVYSILNAFRWAAQDFKRLTYTQGCLFYQDLVSFLLKKEMFTRVLERGTPDAWLVELLGEADLYSRKKFKLALNFECPYVDTEKSVPEALAEIGDFLEREHTAWIVSLYNKTLGSHYTVGTKIVGRRVDLFDSCGGSICHTDHAIWGPKIKKGESAPCPPKGKMYLFKPGQVLITVNRI